MLKKNATLTFFPKKDKPNPDRSRSTTWFSADYDSSQKKN